MELNWIVGMAGGVAFAAVMLWLAVNFLAVRDVFFPPQQAANYEPPTEEMLEPPPPDAAILPRGCLWALRALFWPVELALIVRGKSKNDTHGP